MNAKPEAATGNKKPVTASFTVTQKQPAKIQTECMYLSRKIYRCNE